jgi:gamma-tubulin complex component 3
MTGARSVLGAVQDKVGKDWKAARCVIAEMVHFVSQLQYYILFEVIESSWNELQQAMHKPESTLDDLIQAHAAYLSSITRKGLLGSSTTDFTGQLHELLKTMLAYKDAVDGLYSFSVAEFTKRQEVSARIENRTAAGKWGLSERDSFDDPLSSSVPPSSIGRKHSKGRSPLESSPLLPLPTGLSSGVSEDDILGGLKQRLNALAADFKAKVNVLLGDLYHQPDADMRWLAMVMNFNDTYQPVRRKKRAAAGAEKKTAPQGQRERERESVRANGSGTSGRSSAVGGGSKGEAHV